MQSGDRVANLSLATSESWNDKASGERKEKTEWHRVVVFNQGLVKVIENYVKKGSKLYIEGQLETRSWEQDGQKKYTTEVVLRPYRGELTMLDNRGSAGGLQDSGPPPFESAEPKASNDKAPVMDDMEDEIPF
jgi:single-strand DNA-binding protein